MPHDGPQPAGSLITACKCRSHIRGRIYGGLKATTEYNRVEPIMNRDQIGKYLCACTFLKGCIHFALQKMCWKNAAYPLFIPIRGYYYPFSPKSLASVQIVFLEETEDWIVYKQGSNPVYLLKWALNCISLNIIIKQQEGISLLFIPSLLFTSQHFTQKSMTFFLVIFFPF